MTAVIIVSVIIVLIVLVLTILAISKAYSFKHTVDSVNPSADIITSESEQNETPSRRYSYIRESYF